MPTLRVDDIQMYYEIHGEGRPLVLICGLGNDISEWESTIRWLAQHYQVIAFDNRGAGRTDKPDQPYSIEMMAGDTYGLLRALDIDRATMLGVSMGGRIALALALAHPEQIDRLILVSTSARGIKRTWRFQLLSLVPLVTNFARNLRHKPSQPRYAFRRQREASSAYSCADRLHEIHAPTLIMHGKQDNSMPYALAEELHASIAGSQLLPFADGHIFFFLSEHQRFLDGIVDFMGT